jgi:hypothetical protein
MSCFPAESRPLLIMDRGYSRVALLIELSLEGIPYLVRAQDNVIVYSQGKPIALRRFRVKVGQMQRYRVLYHSKKRFSLDLIVFLGKGYRETWHLLVPPSTPLTTREIVDLYAWRMSIEQGFPDWKTHLGIRGLVFFGDNPAPRLTRLLLAFSLAYLLCLALGSTEEAQSVRTFVEIPRRNPRHGATRTLSALSIAILRLSLRGFRNRAFKELSTVIRLLSSGKGLIFLCQAPP